MTVELEAIGVVRGGRAEIFEDSWGEVTAEIELTTGPASACSPATARCARTTSASPAASW